MTASQHGVFISYRRDDDAAFHAGWLYDELVTKFGEPHVFKDVDSIAPGEDFVDAIKSAVRSCHTLLVMIGPKWLDITDRDGNQRLADPQDFIRLEVETALANGLQIIPVLVLDAVMPSTEALPQPIAALARRNAIEITSRHFKADLGKLVRAVDRVRQARDAMTRSDVRAPIPELGRPGADPRSGAALGLLADRYQQIALLGYGRMSELHRARDLRMPRDVAVKLVHADLARDPQLPARLRRAAESAAALNHPGIVAIYEAGEARTERGDLPYLVMEYVEGRNLRDVVMSSGPLSQERAVDTMAAVCTALDVGHRHHVVHGDISPANIMIDRGGAVRVKNFGIARALAAGPAGTVADDVHAVGAVLYELLTGRQYTGDSLVALSGLNPPISPALGAAVRKALSANPAHRQQSATELHTDLMRVHNAGPPTAPVAPGRDHPTAAYPGLPPRRPDRADGRRPQPAPPAAGRRRSTGKIAAVVLTALIAVGLLGAVGYRWLSPPTGNTVEVPAVYELDEVSATAQLRDAGLRAVRTSRPVDLSQVGTVVDADPPPGTAVARGSSVTITIGTQAGTPLPPTFDPPSPVPPTTASKGPVKPDTVTIPDVTGQDAETARSALEGRGLKVETSEVTDSARAGSVVGTTPEAGATVPVGSVVTLQVSIGDPVAVPNVLGQTLESALRALSTAGFNNVTPTTVEVGDPAQDGIVIGQTPAGGTQVDSTSEEITLTVGQAAPP